MAKFSTNPHRFDPYKNFKFRVKINGRPVAGAAHVSGLSSARKLTGLRKYPNLTMKRGITGSAAFLRWATNLSGSRKDLVIEIRGERGTVDRALRIHRGWVSRIEASSLNARANEVGIESLTLEHEGIELMRS